MADHSKIDLVELRAFIERENLASADLDELVYDLVGEGAASAANQTADSGEQEDLISAGERTASGINNGGLDEQLALIADSFPTLSEAKRAIMDSQ